MTAPVSAFNPQQQQYPCQACEFKPSYNAVQLNLKQPTLNVPQAAPQPQPMAEGTTKNWIA